MELTREALRLARVDAEIEVRIVRTSGDEGSARVVPIDAKAGLKGLFTSEIESQLLAHEIDVAVHSAKDLPGQMRDGLVLGATLQRASPEDVMITKRPCGFLDLRRGAVLATSSVRRAAQLRAVRPDLQIQPMRGNVPTRLRKFRESTEIDALVLARAGLDRLGWDEGDLFVESLREHLLPAAGQGAIALQIRAEDAAAARILDAINHPETLRCVRAEREFLRLLDGDCHLPVGAAATLDRDVLSLRVSVFDEPANTFRRGEMSGSKEEPEQLARRLFASLYPA